MSKQSMDERRSIKLLISKVKSLISTMETIMNNSEEIGFNYSSCNTFMSMYQELVIPDFIVPKLKLCIEVKLIKDKNRKSKVIEEINSDITAYQKKYEHILFIVYDLGTIRDEIEFKRDIEANERNSVIILKQ